MQEMESCRFPSTILLMTSTTKFKGILGKVQSKNFYGKMKTLTFSEGIFYLSFIWQTAHLPGFVLLQNCHFYQ